MRRETARAEAEDMWRARRIKFARELGLDPMLLEDMGLSVIEDEEGETTEAGALAAVEDVDEEEGRAGAEDEESVRGREGERVEDLEACVLMPAASVIEDEEGETTEAGALAAVEAVDDEEGRAGAEDEESVRVREGERVEDLEACVLMPAAAAVVEEEEGERRPLTIGDEEEGRRGAEEEGEDIENLEAQEALEGERRPLTIEDEEERRRGAEEEEEESVGGRDCAAEEHSAEVTQDDGPSFRKKTPPQHIHSAQSWRRNPLSRTRQVDTRFGFFHVSRATRLRVEPRSEEGNLHTHSVKKGDAVRAEEKRDGFIRVAGTWGAGWLPIADVDGAPVLVPLPATQVVLSADFNCRAAAPLPFELQPVTALEDADKPDAVAHRFRALEAISPDLGVARDTLQHVMPAGCSIDEVQRFLRKYDHDGDGKLSLTEFRLADAELLEMWRFKKMWPRFACADVDRDGILNVVELAPMLPLTADGADALRWMTLFDIAGAHGYVTLADFPRMEHVVQRDNVFSLVCSSVTMSVFLTYLKAAKAVMSIFSIERVNGRAYLKQYVV